MPPFSSSVAIVTGGASGIGRALCAALARLGATVVLTDINGDAAAEAARAIAADGGRVRAAPLDVRDADAVKRLVEGVAQEHGKLDYMFNNAGIGIMGEEREVSLDDWKRVLDVNLYGVLHGVRAAYPIMLRQRSGHIVNTASLAGLIPTAYEVSYATSKFAVVGMSISLRLEAAALGVKVSVVCPGFIETPILQNSEVKPGIDRARVRELIPEPLTADRCAKAILAGVARNRAVIVVTGHAKVAYFFYRWAPGLVSWYWAGIIKKVRRMRTPLPVRSARESGGDSR